MKVACLIENINSGGAERQLTGLASMLQNRGFTVEVWTYYEGDFYAPILKQNNVGYKYLSSASGKLLRIPVLLKQILKYRPDYVIAYVDTPCIIACILKFLCPTFKLIVSERNTTQTLDKRENFKFSLYRFADHIVANSYSQTNFINEHFPGLRAKNRCITNFVDTDIFNPLLARTFDNQDIRILTVARIAPQKNVKNYIRAINAIVKNGITNIKVNWVGLVNESDRYYIECRELIKELNLEDIFEVHKATTSVLEWYYKNDVFCLPSLHEGYPNVLCEAMCCGMPVICGDICDNEQISEIDRSMLFNPKDYQDIAEKLTIFLMQTKEQMTLLSERNIEIAKRKFSKDAFIKKYIDIMRP